jgi:DNA-binding GntR family transcriptional regulator
MVKRAGRESLAEEVYAELRSDIYDRRLAPGERLKPIELGARFGVSISVMREALGLLAAQALVKIERNRGFHVTTLSADVLHDLTAARKINEGAAVRMSVERGDVTWESEVLAAHHRLASRPLFLPGDPPLRRNNEWAQAHLAFHYKLIEACGNPVLLDICARLSDAAQLYRAWSSSVDGDTHRDIAAEHYALMQAALGHDADLAVRLFEEHIERTARVLLEFEAAGTQQPAPRRPHRAPAAGGRRKAG